MKEPKFKVGDKVVIVTEGKHYDFFHDSDWKLGDIFEIKEITASENYVIYWSQAGVPVEDDFLTGVLEDALRLATPLEKLL